MNTARSLFVVFCLINFTCGFVNVTQLLFQENDLIGGNASFVIHNTQSLAQIFTVGQSQITYANKLAQMIN
jgi:hypothetical protein